MYAQVSQDDSYASSQGSYSRKRQKRRPVSLKAMRGQKLIRKDEIKDVVRRQLALRFEKKVFIRESWNDTIPNANAGAGVPPQAMICMPGPASGTSDNQRIGDRINIKRHYIKGLINLTPYSLLTNTGVPPYYVKIWIAKYKPSNTTTLATTDVMNNFFQNSTGSNQGFDGSVRDIVSLNYSDLWTIYTTRVIKLGATNALASGPTNTASYLDASSMSVPFYFDLTKYVKGRVDYADGILNPQNKMLWCFMQVVQCDGAVFTTTANLPAEVQWQYVCYYDDA